MATLVVCPPTLFRDGLIQLLQRRPASGGVTVVDHWLALQALQPRPAPRLVLLDLDGLGGLAEDTTLALRRHFNAPPLIGLFEQASHHAPVQACLRAGGTLCVLKSASADVLMAALQAAESSMVFLPKQMLAPGAASATRVRTSQVIERAGTTAADLGLTPKQSRVLGLLLEGKSAKNIARELGLCTGTVKTHTTAVLRALNVNTRVQAVLAARRLGLQVDSCH